MGKSEASDKDSKSLIITAITIGGSLEWYEIGIFISWPLIIEKQVAGFDISIAESLNAGLILLLVILAVANGGARALGGWFFGQRGDSHGRQSAFPLTLLVATIPSWSLAILSFFLSYDIWITYSTVIFAVVKFFQGMPAGGELPGAICYLAESGSGRTGSSMRARRFMCSFALLGPQIGLALSTIVCLILKGLFPEQELQSTVWRYVFIFSGIMGIGGYMMRKRVHETASYLNLKKTHHGVLHKPVKKLFKKLKGRVASGFIFSIYEVTMFSVLQMIPFFYKTFLFELKTGEVFQLALVNSFVMVVLIPIMGRLSSTYFSWPWLKMGIIGGWTFTPVLFFSLLKGYFIVSIISSFLLLICLSIHAAILPSILATMFPVEVRYSGIAFSFNICDGVIWTALTGICIWFLHYSNPLFLFMIPISSLFYFIGKKMMKKNGIPTKWIN